MTGAHICPEIVPLPSGQIRKTHIYWASMQDTKEPYSVSGNQLALH